MTIFDLITVQRRNNGLILRETLEGHQIEVKKLFDIDEGDFKIARIAAENETSKVVGSSCPIGFCLRFWLQIGNEFNGF